MVGYQIESKFGCVSIFQVSIFQVSIFQVSITKFEYESAEVVTGCCTGTTLTELNFLLMTQSTVEVRRGTFVMTCYGEPRMEGSREATVGCHQAEVHDSSPKKYKHSVTLTIVDTEASYA